MPPRWTAISCGDPGGIGGEVALKAVAAQASRHSCLLIGRLEVLQETARNLSLNIEPQPFRSFDHPLPCAVMETPGIHWQPADPAGSPSAAHAAMAWLRAGATLALEKKVAALVTAPVNKQAMIRAGYSFVGQTEWLSEFCGERETGMLLLGPDSRGRWLRVLLATTHLPITQVPGALNRELLQRTIRLADLACRQLGLERRRIAVCGLNPHAGEGGELGREEVELIGPVIREEQSRFEVTGPHSGDTVFYQALRGDYEIVVAMYHDQGLAPLKLAAFEQGVNWTVGLPFVRTSPDHGTAYDLAGRGVADPSSMIAALRLAEQLAQ